MIELYCEYLYDYLLLNSMYDSVHKVLFFLHV